ncbi:hypothetical protein [Niastella sp. OAS944]|uniref:hypothetical protein n=1 Tax=Niastella sp. OAS944 TaxID=2664089 RepID=UPI00349780B3|nr:hypothetical protein [Chitinophagaceae bacterium OAS944]
MTDTKELKKRFKSSIERGTGEAYLLMQKNPNLNFSAEIIKATLTPLSYDPQSEGSRGPYLWELIALSKQQDKIRTAILNGLANEQEDTWALVQLFDLAACFAKQGDKTARQAIYDRFFKKIIEGSGWCGYNSIVDLDGLQGLLFIATTIGQAIEKDPETWQDNMIIDHFQRKHPAIKARNELEKAGKTNRFIKLYLHNIDQTEKRREEWVKKNPRSKINYDTITKNINSKLRVPYYGKDKLLKSDIKKLADDFLKETDRLKLEKYCRVFDKVKYPYDYKPILELAKSKNKKNDRLVEFACGALKYFSGSDIRKFAIDTLKQTKSPWDYLDLLVLNFKIGDSKLLTEIARNCKNEHDTHAIVWGIVNIYRANKTTTCKKPLEAIYDKLNCSSHREDIVRILKENNVLSKQIKKELRYDFDENIRKLA